MRPNDMLSRSKIKMEESIRHVREDAPYFSNGDDDHASLFYKYARGGQTAQQDKFEKSYQPKRTETNLASETINRYQNTNTDYNEYTIVDTGFRKDKSNRNEIMRELRQQYEILKNLNIEESVHYRVGKYETVKEERNSSARDQENSDLSSSTHSKKVSKGRKRDSDTSKEIQAIMMEKKQLQIVIGNSMRKIEELLNNQITMKKQIHELKSQIDGKGGIHYEYEKVIKNYQKNEEQYTSELNKQKHQIEKNALKIKDLTERIRYLEGELAAKDRQIKQNFDKQRELYEAVRIEKDKFLNMEIQWKSQKMELELLEKEKSNEINRLLRLYEGRENNTDKEANFLLKKLQEDLKEKDQKYITIVSEYDHLKKEFQSQKRELQDLHHQYGKEKEKSEKAADKNILQDLLFRSREANENNNKALNDSMNLIFMKMAELEKKSDETLKKEIEGLKKKTEDNKKNTNEQDLLARVIELEKMIDRQITEKNKLAEDIRDMNHHRSELEAKNNKMESHIRDLNEMEEHLKKQIEELQHIKNAYHNTSSENKEIKNQLEAYLIRERESNTYLESSKIALRQKEESYEEQIRQFRRAIDEANFATQKARKEGEFKLNVYKTEQQSEFNRLLADFNRLKEKSGQSDQDLNRIRPQLQAKIAEKQKQIEILKETIQNLKRSHTQTLQNQKRYYEQQVKLVETRTTTEIKSFNDKFIAISTSNEKLMSQISNYIVLEKEVVELRRALRLSKSISTGVDHLWEVKEAEYYNMNEMLRNLSLQNKTW